MSPFLANQDEYSVEEISYDDMMSILSTQRKVQEEEKTEIQPDPDHDNARQDDVSRRISENAKQKLPEWLLNH